jgi:hypothetical protein
MILLTQDTANQIAVTLSELKSDLLPENWLFRFVLDQDDYYEYLIYLTDVSPAPARYNLFNLDEGVDVDFQFVGDYLYEVYQMPAGGSVDYTLGLKVENGKMRLLENPSPLIPTFEPNTETQIYDPNNIP